MNTLPDLFKVYLTSKALSRVSTKNYTSDVRKFIKWFEELFGKAFKSQDLTLDVITLFERSQPFPPRSLERYISSLRKFASFLTDEGLISENPFDRLSALNSQVSIDPWRLSEFKNYLYLKKASSVTIKNYAVDIKAFTEWSQIQIEKNHNISIDNKKIDNYIQFIALDLVEEYKNSLIENLKLSPKTVNRKLSSIRKYLEFAKNSGFSKDYLGINNLQLKKQGEGLKLEDIETAQPNSQFPEEPKLSKIPPVRLFQRLLNPYALLEDKIALKIVDYLNQRRLLKKATRSALLTQGGIKNAPTTLKWHKKLYHHARFSRPNWYKIYHSYAFTRYFHLGILMVYASIVGFMLYSNMFERPNLKTAVAGATTPPRLLSFQGKITDSKNSPVTGPTNLRFAIYSSETASGTALLWQEEHSSVAPDEDGLFSLLLGSKSGIPSSTFNENDNLYLGISIGQTPELIPRQRLATVAYAANAEALSGMMPITDPEAGQSNVVLALDSTGNLTIGGEANPTFAAIGGQFKLSGKTLLLASEEGSNGDIKMIPDGLGRIDIQRPLVNDSDASESGALVPGAVWINDKVAISASESAVAAFIINNNSTGGDLFVASSAGVTKFQLANDGDLTFMGDTLTASSLSTLTSASTLSLATSTLKIGGGIAAILQTESGDDLTITADGGGELTLTSDYNTGVNIGSSSNTPAALSVSGGLGSNAAFIVNQVNEGGAIMSASSSGLTKLTLTNSGRLILSQGIDESSTGQYLCIGEGYEVRRNNTACSLSSERFKKNINNLSYGLDEVLKLRPVTFNFKEEMNLGNELQVGFIAEEVEELAPELVAHDREGRPSGVNYPNMTALLAKSIQELAERLLPVGQTMEEYITLITNQAISSGKYMIRGKEIVSPLASIERVNTDFISPLAPDSEISLTLYKGVLEIHESKASDSAVVASIDNQGNATFSGQLTAENLEASEATISGRLSADTLESSQLTTENATVSGTLYADRIQANSIEGLEDKIASITAGQSNIAYDIESSAINTDFVDLRSISSDFATFRDGLMSLGPTTLTQVTVLESLSIGTNLIIGPNSFDTLGETLEIQPLRQGAISFMAGAVRIETDGTLKVNSDAEFAGEVKINDRLSANVISPLNDDPLIIARGPASTDSALLDIKGSASVSGALTSRKLNLTFAETAFATSDTQAVATGSAGTAVLKKYRNELTITNPNVTPKSLIYITPVGNTNNKVVYLLRQTSEDPETEETEGSFTVGVSSASTATDIKFNWIIVN